jgi:hypothetical protein
MEMEKSFYLVSCKPAYLELLKTRTPGIDPDGEREAAEAVSSFRFVVAITQGGFGQDVIDDERQVKERFLEQLFNLSDIDLPRSPDAFDRFFDLRPVDEFIDLDENV